VKTARNGTRRNAPNQLKNMRFRGEHNQRVDDKCRLSIPSSFRQLLEQNGDSRLVLVKSTTHRCLQAFTARDWEAREDKVMSLPSSEPAVQKLLHFQFASAQAVEPDSHGRIVLAQALRTWAGITAKEEVVLIGQVRRFEVWSGAAWTTTQQEIENDMTGDALGAWNQALAELGL
jgi:MraZ protein